MREIKAVIQPYPKRSKSNKFFAIGKCQGELKDRGG
jgi:hypothetical protein